MGSNPVAPTIFSAPACSNFLTRLFPVPAVAALAKILFRGQKKTETSGRLQHAEI
jgi:hypothetical protein